MPIRPLPPSGPELYSILSVSSQQSWCPDNLRCLLPGLCLFLSETHTADKVLPVASIFNCVLSRKHHF